MFYISNTPTEIIDYRIFCSDLQQTKLLLYMASLTNGINTIIAWYLA